LPVVTQLKNDIILVVVFIKNYEGRTKKMLETEAQQKDLCAG
jgi:hypothetical protein